MTGKKVEMHNNLVRHTVEDLASNLTSANQRVVCYLAATGIDSEGQLPEFVTGSVNDLAGICGYQGGNIYRLVKDSVDDLIGKKIKFRHPETGNPVTTAWIAQGEYIEGEGIFKVQFSESMRKVLSELHGFRTVMELGVLLKMGSSNYAIRLYQLAKSYQSMKAWNESIETIRKQLGVPEGAYKRTNQIKANVLDYPIKIINDRTDIELSYKKGNQTGRKWTHIAFEVKKKKGWKQAQEPDEKEAFIDRMKSDVGLERMFREAGYSLYPEMIDDEENAWAFFLNHFSEIKRKMEQTEFDL